MKTVKSSDLRDLIMELYSEKISDILPMDSRGILPFVTIDINSVYIKIQDRKKIESSNMIAEKELEIKEFSQSLENITLGNLKVEEFKYTLNGWIIRISVNYNVIKE